MAANKSSKKVAPAPLAAKKETKEKKVKSRLIEKKPRNFSIGNDIQPQRDLTRYVRWPKYVTLQRKKRVLVQRLKVSTRSSPLPLPRPFCRFQYLVCWMRLRMLRVQVRLLALHQCGQGLEPYA